MSAIRYEVVDAAVEVAARSISETLCVSGVSSLTAMLNAIATAMAMADRDATADYLTVLADVSRDGKNTPDRDKRREQAFRRICQAADAAAEQYARGLQ